MTPIPPARVNVRAGYTLVEILVATTLTLILMFAVVQIFAMIGGSVSESRALLEMNDRLRSAKTRLQMDLEGMTVVPLPPRSEEGDGYLEIIEGNVMVPVVATAPAGTVLPKVRARNTVDSTTPTDDTTVADFDDVIMFTTRNPRTPFVGMVNGVLVESDVAEVAWFVHGNRLYRRVRPVERDSASSRPDLAALARRENRGWRASAGSATAPSNAERDFWTNDANNDYTTFGSFATFASSASPTQAEMEEIAADVILNNVIGFDVKVFDVPAGEYVDLGFNPGFGSSFSELGQSTSLLTGQRIYDTWSTSYGTDQPPYPSALRGIQIKIRVFEPDSRQIREVTVIQDFVPR